MLKIGVIGARETVMGFRALGLDTFPVSTKEEAHSALRAATAEGSEYAILYLEETFAQDLEKEINRFKDVPTPAIILIPGPQGTLNLGQNALHDAVERAVGTDILNEG